VASGNGSRPPRPAEPEHRAKQHGERRERPEPVDEVDRHPGRRVEHPELVVDAEPPPQHEALGEVGLGGPPLALAGGHVRAGQGGVVGARPAAEGDLRPQHHQREDGRGGAGGHGGRPRPVPPQVVDEEPGEDRQRREAAEQVAHDDQWLQQQGHGPHAEQALEADHGQQHERHAPRLVRVVAVAEGRDDHADDHEPQRGRDVAVDHLAPGLAGLDGALREARLGRVERAGVGGQDEVAVAAGPVGAAEACVGQADPGAEHHHRQGQGDPGGERAAVPAAGGGGRGGACHVSRSARP
jgi:hypothetical protein